MAAGKKTGLLTLSGVVLFLLGYSAHALISNSANTIVTDGGVREQGKYTYIAPLLYCSSAERKDLGPYKVLNKKIQSIIDSKITSGAASGVSVFFRDTKGRWVGINDDKVYPPASLLKVPLMIAYLKQAESNPSILSLRFTYTTYQDLNTIETFKPESKLTPGASYSVQELITSMIEDSDNNATRILFEHINTDVIDEVNTDLGLPVGDDKNPDAGNLSPKMFTNFLRVLYNATYLSPEYSEMALSILSKSSFNMGLAAGVPKDIVIANKYGERTTIQKDGSIGTRTLSDCGIVYEKNSPYFLCVMAQGTDFSSLTTVIKEISQSTYTEIASQGGSGL